MPGVRDFDSLKTTLSKAYPTLSPQLQAIARHALEHPQEMALDTVASIARSAGVQPSSLVRFAKALGFGGFSDLQQVFRGRLVAHSRRGRSDGTYLSRIEAWRAEHARSRGNGRGDGAASVVAEFVAEGVASLDQLTDHIRPGQLDTAIRLLAAARNIHVLGQRRAFPVAYYLAYALTQLDLPARLLDNVGGMLADQARLIGSKDALLVISFRTYTTEVVETARACHQRGVPVIAITDHALSPLVPASRVCFEVEERTSKPFRMLVAPVCLAQALVVAVGEHLAQKGAARRTGA